MSVLATYRDSDLSSSHPLTGLLADLHRESTVRRIDVSGLDDSEIIELVETASGYKLDVEGVALAHALRGARQVAIRSSWASCYAIWESRGRSSRTTRDGSTWLAISRTWRCRPVCAMW